MTCSYCGQALDAQPVQTPRGCQHGACVAAQQAQYAPPYGQGPYAPMQVAQVVDEDVLPGWWLLLLYGTIPLCGLHFPVAIIARILSVTWRDQYPTKAASLRKHQIISSLITGVLGLSLYVAMRSL